MYVRNNRNGQSVQAVSRRSIDQLFTEIEEARREGNSQHAYELSVQATQNEPDNAQAWWLRLGLSTSFEERLNCLNRLNELAPQHSDTYNLGYFTLKELIDKNPFLAYLGETQDLYRVMNGNHVMVSIQKNRSAANDSPPDRSNSPLRGAYTWLVFALAGLLLAGAGTLIFAPVAAWAAVRARRSNLSPADHVKSGVVFSAAILLFLLGSIFTFLFILHWVG